MKDILTRCEVVQTGVRREEGGLADGRFLIRRRRSSLLSLSLSLLFRASGTERGRRKALALREERTREPRERQASLARHARFLSSAVVVRRRRRVSPRLSVVTVLTFLLFRERSRRALSGLRSLRLCSPPLFFREHRPKLKQHRSTLKTAERRRERKDKVLLFNRFPFLRVSFLPSSSHLRERFRPLLFKPSEPP